MTKTRILTIGTANGGTTAFSKCFLQLPNIHVDSSRIQKRDGLPGFYHDDPSQYDATLLYNKETVGVTYTDFPIFPDCLADHKDELFIIFLYRDPVKVWNSWLHRKWAVDDEPQLSILFEAFKRLKELREDASESGMDYVIIDFDQFRQQRKEHLMQLCTCIGIPYQDCMLSWKKPWGDRRGKDGNPEIDDNGFHDKEKPCIVSEDHQRSIESRLGIHYRQLVFENHFLQVPSIV